MIFTVYSAVASFLWCSLFAIIICLYLKKEYFLMRCGIYPVIILILLFLVRLTAQFELSTTYVVNSFQLLPKLQLILTFMPFAIFSDKITITVSDILLTVWITGTLIYFARLLQQNIRFRFALIRKSIPAEKHIYNLLRRICKQQKIRRRLQIIWTPLIDVPVITGFFRPVICLPDIKLTDQELQYILKHEWNHFIYKDL